MSAPETFKERMLAQQWHQGAYVPWRGELARSIRDHGVRGCDLRADPGAPAARGEESEGYFVLISQLCDLTAGDAEPFAVVIPAGPWDLDGGASLPKPNSSRWFIVDRSARIVASQALLIPFNKELIPDQQAVLPPLHADLFATWCARRWRRTPLPDDFTETVQRALAYALERVKNQAGLEGTACWRAQLLGHNGEGRQVARLIAVYDRSKIDETAFTNYAEAVVTKLEARLPTDTARAAAGGDLSPFVLEPVAVIGQHELSVEVAIQSPMIIFDHLSPVPMVDESGDDLQGLRDEDVY